MSCKSLFSALAVGGVLAASQHASAVIVVQDDTIVDGGNNLNATEFVNFGGAFITTGTDLSDGNSFGVIHQIGEFSAAGLSHHIPIADITSVQPLVDGITLRVSAWFVSDPLNPWTAVDTDGFKFEFYNTALGTVNTGDMNSDTPVGFGLGLVKVAHWPSTTAWLQESFTVSLTDALVGYGTLEEVRLGLFEGDFSGRSAGAGGGRLFVDGLVVEVFPDLAAANATALPNNQPGGFTPIPEPATLSLMGLGGAVMLRRR